MRKYLITLVPVAFLGWHSGNQNERSSEGISVERIDTDDLKPTDVQVKADAWVVRLLSNRHYRKIKFSDSLSSAMYDRYVETIDRSKMYLLESDVAEYEKHRYNFDDFVIQGKLEVPFEMYNLFRKRYKERSQYIQDLLSKDKPFDFNQDESLNADREHAKWSQSTEELNDVWRKFIKNEALEMRLAGKADTAAVNLLKERYKNRDRALARIRSDQVFQMFMNSYAESLDPHTNYFAPAAADRFKQDMYQSLEGIGAVLQEDGNYIKINDLIPGGPAYRSKFFKKEDKIVGVAQGDEGKMVDIIGWFVDDAVKLIKGPKGTTVRLSILPADALPGAAPKEYRIVREKVKIEEKRAKKEILSVDNGGKTSKIGIIEIPIFYRDFEGAQQREKEFGSTTRDVQRLIKELEAEKVEGIVVDLRNNGGGSLIEAVSLTGLFISKGPVVQVREEDGSVEVQSDTDPSVAYSGPLAVMINRFSASASEIFAGAIQDYKRGVIVGENSFGKGTVQTMIDLNQYEPREKSPLGELKMTIAKFYRVDGSSTQLKGVKPDLEFPSAFKPNEYMESSEKGALPWDRILTSQYVPTNDISEKTISKLKAGYQSRLKSNEDLKKYVADIEIFRKSREQKTVSLLESKRKKEYQDAEKKSAALKQLEEEEEGDDEPADTKSLRKDVYLNETGRIMVDLIDLRGNGTLANRKKEK